jgi:hypothetical protein
VPEARVTEQTKALHKTIEFKAPFATSERHERVAPLISNEISCGGDEKEAYVIRPFPTNRPHPDQTNVRNSENVCHRQSTDKNKTKRHLKVKTFIILNPDGLDEKNWFLDCKQSLMF